MEIMKKPRPSPPTDTAGIRTVRSKLGFDGSVKFFDIFASQTKLLKSVGYILLRLTIPFNLAQSIKDI